jgi:nucleoside-triphosphatase THEP1
MKMTRATQVGDVVVAAEVVDVVVQEDADKVAEAVEAAVDEENLVQAVVHPRVRQRRPVLDDTRTQMTQMTMTMPSI